MPSAKRTSIVWVWTFPADAPQQTIYGINKWWRCQSAFPTGAHLDMDEPTSSLTLSETERLIAVVKDLKSVAVVSSISLTAREVKELLIAWWLCARGNAGDFARSDSSRRMVRMMVARPRNFYVHPKELFTTLL